MERKRKHRNIISHITALQLAQPDEPGDLTEDDLYEDLTSSRGTFLFLGQYSRRGILFALDKLGILSHLERIGLNTISVDIDTSRPFQHFLRFFHTVDGKKYLISEVVMRRGTFSFPENVGAPLNRKSYDIVVVEWLLLQNPLSEFTKERPQLPGQEMPGLELGTEVLEIFYWVARRAGADGALIVPTSLHSAIIYSREFFFPDPWYQAMASRVKTDLLRRMGLAQTSWACEEGKIMNRKTRSILKWDPSEMILPVSKSMNDYFFSVYYRSKVTRLLDEFDLVIEQGYKKRFDKDWKA